jgi:hypothetical protein
MKRPLLVVAFLTLACAALLAPIRSMPLMLVSDVGGVEWKCSSSALILTTCVPSRDVRFNSINRYHQAVAAVSVGANGKHHPLSAIQSAILAMHSSSV